MAKKRIAGPILNSLTRGIEGRRGQKYAMARWCDEHDCWVTQCQDREHDE